MHAWSEPPAKVQTPHNEIHVWRVRLDPPPSVVRQLEPLLQNEEREKAYRFRYPGGKEKAIIARGALRQILSRYVEISPREISFVYGSYGKPELADPLCRFNLTHSGNMALVAVTGVSEIGVDVEQLREIRRPRELAERFFCPEEAEQLTGKGEPLARAFLRTWTRKESVIKAVGEGLSMPLNTFNVTTPADITTLRVTAGGKNCAPAQWCLQDLAGIAGYQAAVCTREQFTVRCWSWTA